jgi:hypothetical protein
MFLGIELTLVVPEDNTSETVLGILESVVQIWIHKSGPDASLFVNGFQNANKK